MRILIGNRYSMGGKKMSQGAKIGIIWGVLLVLMIGVSSNTKMDSTLTAGLYIVVGIAVTIMYSIAESKINSRPENQPKVSIVSKRDPNTNNVVGYTLLVKERAAVNKKALKVTRKSNYAFTYHPERTVYTGATVGGVTTGGFHTEKAHHTYSVSPSDKYVLNYIWLSESSPSAIKEIQLESQVLIEEARKTPVVQSFLECNKLNLQKPMSKETAERIAALVRNADETTKMNVLMQYNAQDGLSKREADAIFNWLCGYNG